MCCANMIIMFVCVKMDIDVYGWPSMPKRLIATRRDTKSTCRDTKSTRRDTKSTRRDTKSTRRVSSSARSVVN